MQNSPYGLFTPENYWMMQNLAQSRSSYMPLMPSGSPSFTGASTGSTSSAQKPKTTKEQIALIDEKLKEAYAIKNQAADTVEITLDGQNHVLSKDAYDAESGMLVADGKNDGKIDGWSKFKNFLKGCGNLVTNMFFDEQGHFSVAQTAKTVAIGAVAAAVCTFVPFAAPAMVGLGLATGAWELGKGVYKAIDADTDIEAERAWQSIGTGALTTGLSLWGAKAMGKAATAPGGEAPKWYRPDQSLLKAGKASYAEWIANPKAYMAGKWESMKLAFDKAVSKRINYSHYEARYNQAMSYIDNQINATTGGTKMRWEYMKDLYSKMRNCSDETLMAGYKEELSHLAQWAKGNLDALKAGGASADDIAAAQKALSLTDTVVPEFANVIKMTKVSADTYKVAMQAIDDELTALRANPASRPERIQLLEQTKLQFESLYKAKTPVEQQTVMDALKNLQQRMADDVVHYRNAGVTAEEMAFRNELHALAQQNITSADVIMQARRASFEKALNILKSASSVKEDVEATKLFLDKYKTILDRLNDNDDYVRLAERLLSESGSSGVGQFLSKAGGMGKSALAATKGSLRKVVRTVKTPEFQFVRPFLECEQNIWGAVPAALAQNSERSQLLKSNNELITKLQQMRYDVSCGKTVDLSILG